MFLLQNWDEIIEMILRINFMLITSFNIIFIVKIDVMQQVRTILESRGAVATQSGHFLIRGAKAAKGNFNCARESQVCFEGCLSFRTTIAYA